MTAVDPDRLFLVDMLDHARRVMEFTSAGRDAFLKDRLIQGAVLHSLAIVGEAAKQVSQELKSAHPEIRWRPIAGLRDKIVHAYMQVDLAEVWVIAERDVPPLAEALQGILAGRGWG